ncbi:MAG: hypothetical protein R3B45_10540 [Bdellovibrionota bacterium]
MSSAKYFCIGQIVAAIFLVLVGRFFLSETNWQSFLYGVSLFSINLCMLTWILKVFFESYKSQFVTVSQANIPDEDDEEAPKAKINPLFFGLALFKMLFLGLCVYFGIVTLNLSGFPMVWGGFLGLLSAGGVGIILYLFDRRKPIIEK